MTVKESENIRDLLNYLKKEWRAHPADGSFSLSRENQIRRDCIQAVCYFLDIDTKINMTELPNTFNPKDNRKNKFKL